VSEGFKSALPLPLGIGRPQVTGSQGFVGLPWFRGGVPQVTATYGYRLWPWFAGGTDGTVVPPVPPPPPPPSGRWHPDDAKKPRRGPKPIIYVDEDGQPVELGRKPPPVVAEPQETVPAAREDIPLDLLASRLAEDAQALAAAAMARVQDEIARFLIIQRIEALAAEEARNAAIIQQIILDVVSRETDDEEAIMLLAASV
jgi:hypothetical protein